MAQNAQSPSLIVVGEVVALADKLAGLMFHQNPPFVAARNFLLHIYSSIKEATDMDQQRLTHLQQLEAESIHIIREVAAEFDNPVMMYSIGKDSSVMLHLARKAFYPGKIPFPLLHVDTDWKFKDMIAFRDRMAKKYDFELLVHKNPEGLAMGCSPLPMVHQNIPIL